MNIIRWLFVVPGAILAAVLIAFPVHWFVMINFGGHGYEPIIEIRDESELYAIECFLQALAGPFAFVYAAASIAPSRRVLVSIATTLLLLGGILYLVTVVVSRHGVDISESYGPFTFLENVVGAVCATALVFFRREPETHTTGSFSAIQT